MCSKECEEREYGLGNKEPAMQDLQTGRDKGLQWGLQLRFPPFNPQFLFALR
jgi:hypothetical protein